MCLYLYSPFYDGGFILETNHWLVSICLKSGDNTAGVIWEWCVFVLRLNMCLQTISSCAVKLFNCIWPKKTPIENNYPSVPGAVYSTYVIHKPMTQSLQLLIWVSVSNELICLINLALIKQSIKLPGHTYKGSQSYIVPTYVIFCKYSNQQ